MGIFTAKYSDRIDEYIAKEVINNGNYLGRSDYEKGSCWNVYEYNGNYFIQLSDFNDVWNADLDDVNLYATNK